MVRFSKKKSYWIKNACFDFLYTLCLKHFSFYEEISEISPKMSIGLHVKYPFCLSDFNGTWMFSTVSKNPLISNFTKIRQVGVELFHADGRTDMTKLTIAFSNFANAPKKLNTLQLNFQRTSSVWFTLSIRPHTWSYFGKPKHRCCKRVKEHSARIIPRKNSLKSPTEISKEKQFSSEMMCNFTLLYTNAYKKKYNKTSSPQQVRFR